MLLDMFDNSKCEGKVGKTNAGREVGYESFGCAFVSLILSLKIASQRFQVVNWKSGKKPN